MDSESQNIEYKESWNDRYLEWICGFANAQGGCVYIGVDDDKKVVGVKDCERLMEDIPNKIVTHLGIVADVNLLKAEGLGYRKIMEGFKTAGLKLPTIELVDGGVKVTVWRDVVSGNVTSLSLVQLTDRQKNILRQLIRSGQSNVTENVTENVTTLSKLLKVSERTIKRDLAKLQTLGVIRRDGPDKGGKWVVIENNNSNI